MEVFFMIHRGEERTNGIRCRFNPSIGINFQGAKISSDPGILLLREIDERFGITSALEGILQDTRIVSHTQHSWTDLLRQRVYQIAAGYEDCKDANEFRRDPGPSSGPTQKQCLCGKSATLVTI